MRAAMALTGATVQRCRSLAIRQSFYAIGGFEVDQSGIPIIRFILGPGQ